MRCGDDDSVHREDSTEFARRRMEVGNVPNLMVGSGMQQAHNGIAEETAEVVRDHVGGTGSARVAPS